MVLSGISDLLKLILNKRSPEKQLWCIKLLEIGGWINVTDTVKAMNHLKEIIRDLGIPKDLIRANALINRDLQLDSTEIVEISLTLKRRLGIRVKLESRHDKSLAEVSEAIASAIAERNH